jgi:hypothetical protein
MWQSPTPIKSFFGKELVGREAWIQVFAATWEALEIDKEELWVPALEIFGTAIAETHGDEDPAVVARRLYPEAGDCFGDLYPASVRQPPNPASFSRPDDVPFYR